MRTRRILSLILLAPMVVNAGCKACFTPTLPGPDIKDTHTDSGETGDTQETAETGDTSPPVDTTPEPPCDVPEIEPHAYSAPQELPLDQWACGYFEYNFDYEYFTVTTTQSDWVRFQIKASSIRSSADTTVLIVDSSDGSRYANVTGGAETVDPFAVFPISEATEFRAVLGETYYGYGEDYTWEMMATITKPPVEWTATEVEPNDDETTAIALAEGDVMFAISDYTDDLDNFKISIPDERERYVKVTVVANAEGSPADMRVIAYEPDGTYRKAASSGASAYDRDPILEFTTDVAGDWIIELREDYSKGSPWYWYTLSVEISDPAVEDTASADGTSDGA